MPRPMTPTQLTALTSASASACSRSPVRYSIMAALPEVEAPCGVSRRARTHVALDRRPALLPGLCQVVRGLEAHPEFGTGAEEACEPQRRVRRNRALGPNDGAD